MSRNLVSAKEWIQEQLGEADLGDARVTKRLVKSATAIAQRCGRSLPVAIVGWGDLKATYRLLANPGVTYEGIIGPHWQKTLSECQLPGEYLLVEDTTGLHFQTTAKGLSRAGKGEVRGMHVHSSMALKIWGWDGVEPLVTVVGLLGQKIWVREGKAKRGKETRKQRLARPKESDRWGAVFDGTGAPLEGSLWTYVADRESDIFRVIGKCRDKGIGYIIRASWPRKVQGGNRTIQEAVRSAEVIGQMELKLRSRSGQKARIAKLQVRSIRVRVRPPRVGGKGLKAEEENIVEVREVGAAKGVDEIHWVILTSWASATLEQAARVVRAYAKRWLIEEYHKALKTGTAIEQSQLSSRERLERLFGMLAVVALWLLNAKLLCATHPDEPVNVEVIGEDVLMLLEALYGRPEGGWTNASVLIGIARQGGFLARKGDGNPGWITIWRGWQNIMIMCDGLELMRKHQKCG